MHLIFLGMLYSLPFVAAERDRGEGGQGTGQRC